MAIGEIGSALNELWYDEDVTINFFTPLNIADNIIAVWYQGDNHGFVKTFQITDAGIITEIDVWNFETGVYYSSSMTNSVVKVSGNIYACCYGLDAAGDELRIKTMTIGTDGIITKTAIETFTDGLSMAGGFHYFSRKAGTNVYVASWYNTSTSNTTGKIATININSDGTSMSTLDSWEFDSNGLYPSTIHITGDVYAVLYEDGTNGVLNTFEIDDNGIITKSFTDTVIVDPTYNSRYHQPVHVSGDVYAVFYQDVSNLLARVATFSIDASGTITLIASDRIDNVTLTEGLQPAPTHVLTNGSTYYYFVSTHEDYKGWVISYRIKSDGTLTGFIDSEKVIASSFGSRSATVKVKTGLYAVVWLYMPGGRGHITTYDAEIPSTVYPDSGLTRVTALRHLYRPGQYKLFANLGFVSQKVEYVEYTPPAMEDDEPPIDVIVQPPEPVYPPYEPGPYLPPYPDPDAFPPYEPGITSEPQWTGRYGPGYIGSVVNGRLELPKGTSELINNLILNDINNERITQTRSRKLGWEEPSSMVSKVWQGITPWKESEGETFFSAISNMFKGLFKW